MKGKLLGIFLLLVGLCVFMTFATATPWYDIRSSQFLTPANVMNLLSRISLYGIMGIGVSFVIISSGIDLSIGSTVCLSAVLLSLFLKVDYAATRQLNITQINADNQTIEAEGEFAGFASSGDLIRYSSASGGGQVFTVKEITSAGRIVVQEKPARTETGGRLVRCYPLESVTVTATGDSRSATTVLLQPAVEVKANDQLTLVLKTGGVSTQKVTAVQNSAVSTTLTLERDPGKRFHSGAVAVPLRRHLRMPVVLAIVSVLLIACLLGLFHGFLVTRARLQPFVVTLCTLLVYRGVSRWLTEDNPAGFGEMQEVLGPVASGKVPVFIRGEALVFGIPIPFFLLLATGAAGAILLGRTVWGRYLMALGRNEEAARFSGINTSRVTLLAYVICTTLAAVGGMLFALDSQSVSPSSFGLSFEFYAIAAAVLGGCSLRGGEGSIVGVIIGTALMQVLNNLIMLLQISGTLETTIIGSVILIGVLVDEYAQRIAAERRRRQSVA